jgi:YidC/Oxa1 family membrane protein insertase
MSTEKRALIAMVLMLVVLMFYWMYAPNRQRPAEPAATEEAAVEKATREEAQAEAGEAAGVGVPTAEGREEAPQAGMGELAFAGGPGEDIDVETPLVSAIFNTTGGVIKSFQLKRYPGAGEAVVELIPESENYALGLALYTEAGDRVDLSGAAFEASAGSVEVEPGAEAMLMFTLRTEQGLEVVKSVKFKSDTYMLDVAVSVSGPGSEAVRAVEMGWQSGLATTEKNVNDDRRNFAALTFLADGSLEKQSLKNVEKQDVIKTGGEIRWAGVKTKYFLAAFVPVEAGRTISKAYPSGEASIGMSLETDKPGDGIQSYLLYVGPLDYNLLKAYDLGLEKSVDFGWKWISPLSRLLFSFMLMVYRVVPNYGLVIILLSVLIKILFWPLTQKSFTSMREMQKVQPALSKLREKYKDDPKKLNEEMWKLYKERGINPAGGCFPMLLQTPVFIALFNLLSRTIELRRAPFMLWIHDLSAPDVAAHLPFSLPFIGSNVSVLPILMGIAMFIQQKMTSTDPKNAAMTYMLPIIFTVIFYRFPSGLVLYWLVNNILTIMHQYLLARSDQPEPPPIPEET